MESADYLCDGNLFIGENGQIFVLKDFYRRKNEKNYNLEHILKQPSLYPELDINLTKLMMREVPERKVNPDRSRFVNQLNKPFPELKNTENEVYINNFPEIGDDLINEFVQKAGLEFYRKDIVSRVKFNPQNGKIDYLDPKTGKPTDLPAQGIFDENKITMYNEIVLFSKEDYNSVLALDEEIKKQEKMTPEKTIWDVRDTVLANKSAKEKALYKVYERMQTKETSVKKALWHEIRHFKSNLLIEARLLKENSLNLTLKNLFAKNIDDERSAFFEETAYSINTYLEKGNYTNFSMFGEADKLIVGMLKKYQYNPKLSDEEKQEKTFRFLTDYPKLMSITYTLWNNDLNDYKDDIAGISREDAFKQPLSRETEKDNSEYKLMRSLMYSYKMFNPYSKKYEQRDLSQKMMIMQNGKSELCDVSQNMEKLNGFLNIAETFKTEINEISKALKLSQLTSMLTLKKMPKDMVKRARQLAKNRFSQSSASSHFTFVQNTTSISI